MFLLARQWLDARDATFAAVLYAVNPYHLVIVYWRSAFAELLASCLLPLLLLLLLRADEEGRARNGLSGAGAGGCAWLVNAPAAVMIHYSLALLMIVIAWQRRSPRILLVGLRLCCWARRWPPFICCPRFTNRSGSTLRGGFPGSRPLDNFLFVHTADADHDALQSRHFVDCGRGDLLTIAAAWAARSWRSRNREVLAMRC